MTQEVVIADMQGRDLAAERVRARVLQQDVAAEMRVSRTVLSFVENEHVPLTADFARDYLAAIERCKAKRGEA